MATYSQQMQSLFERYRREKSCDPVDLREVGAWAIKNKLWEPRQADVNARFARDMADSLREEYRTDKAGRRYRSKIVAKLRTKGGAPLFVWADIDDAPRHHVENGVALKRKSIVGDCHQLRVDVDHYNDGKTEEEHIQLILDFTEDVEEMMMQKGADNDDEAA